MKGRRSKWRGGPSAIRPRSRSPMMRDKRRCRPQERPHMFSGCRSPSAERRQDHRHVNDLLHDPSPPPQHRRLSPSPQNWHRSSSPTPFSLCNDGFGLQHERMLPASKPPWKPSNSIRGFHHEIVGALPAFSGDLERHGLLLKRPNMMEEGLSPPHHHQHGSPSPLTFSLCNEGFGLQSKCPASNPTSKPSHSIKYKDLHYQVDEALPPSSVDIERHRLLLKKSNLIEEGYSPSPKHHHRLTSLPHFSSCNDGFRLQHTNLLPASDPTWKPSRSNKDVEFQHKIVEALPPPSVDIERHGLLLKKSNLMEEGPSQSLYSDQLMKSNVLGNERLRSSGGSFGMGIEECELHCYYNRQRYKYDGMRREHVYSKDLSFHENPPSQLRPFTRTTPSSILKDEFKGAHHDVAFDGLAARIIRCPNDPMESNAYKKVSLPDSMRHGLLDESWEYDYNIHKRGLDDHWHRLADKTYERMPSVSRSEFRDASRLSTLDYTRDHMDKTDASNRNCIENALSHNHNSLHREAQPDHHNSRAQEEELLNNVDSWHSGLHTKSSRGYENMHLDEGLSFEKDHIPLSSRVELRTRGSWFSDHDLDEHRLAMSTHGRSFLDELSDYDQENMRLTNYVIDKDMDETEPLKMFVNGQSSILPGEDEEVWLSEEPVGLSLSKSVPLEQSRYRTFSRSISRSGALMPSSGACSSHAENKYNIRLKGKIKYRHSGIRNSSFSHKRQDLLGSYKYCERSLHDRLGVHGRRADGSGARFVKNDPPEDTEEFKQQVHKAFLRFYKFLNEDPGHQKQYSDQGNTKSLLCCVCGSSSKQFVGTHSLVTHMYHSLKVGLRTEHLGFHKALCLLLGWNWRIPPEGSRAYQSMPLNELKSLREDLILWPPIVIIYNILVGGESNTKPGKVQTIEDMGKIIRDMGFGAGLSQICLGKPANQSIFTVKFMPTFSGLQEAERLHRHFAGKMRGKQDFQRSISREFPLQNKAESQFEEVDEILYGYMAVAEDLDKLNPETKKRSLIKSKMDIEAIADAPLNTD